MIRRRRMLCELDSAIIKKTLCVSLRRSASALNSEGVSEMKKRVDLWPTRFQKLRFA